jgi:nucleoside-diphosphate-sugar epimerase
LTGTGCISDVNDPQWAGKENPRIWNDVTHIEDLYNLPLDALHREGDKLITDASNDLMKTLSIVPPDIYGQTTGVGNRTTFMVPEYVKAVMKRKEAFYLGDGDNFRAVSHISDVTSAWVILLGEALKGGGRARWGKEV